MARGLLGLAVSIEQANYHVAQNGKMYFSFWARLNYGAEYFATSGWKYFPDDQKVTTPSQMKGPGHFFNTSKVSGGFLQEITKAAVAHFAPLVEVLREQDVEQDVEVVAGSKNAS